MTNALSYSSTVACRFEGMLRRVLDPLAEEACALVCAVLSFSAGARRPLVCAARKCLHIRLHSVTAAR